MYRVPIHKEEVLMKATVLDLRYKMNEVLKALDKREKVTLLYHGKVKGTIYPESGRKATKVEDRSVVQQMDALRGSRFNAI
jgi:hypothetical protein